MNLNDFKEYLRGKKIDSEKIDNSIRIIKEFNEFLSPGKSVELATYDDLHNFSLYLIEKKKNNFENFVSLLRYGYYTKNDPLIIASLEILDGSEVMENLSTRLINEFSVELRDKIFNEIKIPPLGLHPKEKPPITKILIDRLTKELDHETCTNFLANGLRDKYTDSYRSAREKFLKSKTIDEFLEVQRQEFINTLTKHQEEGSLFFTQKIDNKVIDYVKNQEGMTEAGTRVGNKVFITKIPYLAKEYLSTTDERMKKYYYCHCPWVREAIKTEEQAIDPIFCNCSGGYYKNFWEAVLDQPVRVELLESVLKGDSVCKFALHLPQEIINTFEK